MSGRPSASSGGRELLVVAVSLYSSFSLIPGRAGHEKPVVTLRSHTPNF